ncbi:MAG: type II toxin-antitoxin system mRNA interferase toxin, RelE/StbE family [Deltaproteobacteria bacterium]|nr:type II toxin-antitoxin system mRNA interferase toxin, RelE/StbE family [Deltaproteobacteria bacterium]
MWLVKEHRKIKKILDKVPKQVKENFIAWKRIVELQGPIGLRNIRGFNDEKLKGQWDGFRSSRLGDQWRLIYTYESEVFTVYVLEITSHRY